MKKRGKKKVLIVVHGVWPIKFRNKFFEKIRKLLLEGFTSSRGILRKDYENLMDYLEKDYDRVEFLKWRGWLYKNYDIVNGKRNLIKLLEKYNNEIIDIVAVSLGGLVTQSALLEKEKIKINKLLFLAAIQDKNKIINNSKKIINIFSKEDKMFFFVNEIYTGSKNYYLKGKNTQNIIIKGLRHDHLCLNQRIKDKKYKEKHLFELYKNLLKSKKV